MPINIFLLGKSDSDNGEFVRKYADWVTTEENKQVVRKENRRVASSVTTAKRGILRQSFQRSTYPWQTYIFKQIEADQDRNADYESLRTLTRFPTSTADAVVYFVKVSATNQDNFFEHAQQSLQTQKRCDFSDIHALRYLIITDAHMLREGNRNQAIDDLIDYAKSNGIQKIFVLGDKNQQNLDDLFKEIDTTLKEPNIVSSILGFMLFAILGILSHFIFYNPITAFLIAWERMRWNGVTNKILNVVVLLSFPFWYPVIPIVEALFLNPGGYRGVLNGLETPYYTARDLWVNYRKSTITSLIIIGLMAATVALVLGVFGPLVIGGVGLTALAVKGATSLVAYSGIAGFSMFGVTAISPLGLAAVAGAVVGIAGMIVYGLGSGVVKAINTLLYYQPRRNQELPHDSIEMTAIPSSVSQPRPIFYNPGNSPPVVASLAVPPAQDRLRAHHAESVRPSPLGVSVTRHGAGAKPGETNGAPPPLPAAELPEADMEKYVYFGTQSSTAP